MNSFRYQIDSVKCFQHANCSFHLNLREREWSTSQRKKGELFSFLFLMRKGWSCAVRYVHIFGRLPSQSLCFLHVRRHAHSNDDDDQTTHISSSRFLSILDTKWSNSSLKSKITMWERASTIYLFSSISAPFQHNLLFSAYFLYLYFKFLKISGNFSWAYVFIYLHTNAPRNRLKGPRKRGSSDASFMENWFLRDLCPIIYLA